MPRSGGLSDVNRKLLVLDIHRAIEEVAEGLARALVDCALDKCAVYPPNSGFTEDESRALSKFKEVPGVESALRKCFASAASTAVYQLLTVIDGIGDPRGKGWTGVSLLDKDSSDGEGLFLHTAFFDSYWEWRRIRPKKAWKLDLWDGD